MKVGFTGPRQGMTDAQRERLIVELHAAGAVELHHGDCTGADEEADAVAVTLGIRRVAHPGPGRGLRAFCACEEIREPAPFLVRNHRIVLETGLLIAAPAGRETLRSQTWATIRFARRRVLPFLVITPRGVLA
jgi:hypothetical protein